MNPLLMKVNHYEGEGNPEGYADEKSPQKDSVPCASDGSSYPPENMM